MLARRFIQPYVTHGQKATAVKKVTVSIPLHILRLLSNERTRRQTRNLRHASNSDLLCEAFLHAFTGQPLPTDEELKRDMTTKKTTAKKTAVKKAASKVVAKKAAMKKPMKASATAVKKTAATKSTAKKAVMKKAVMKKATPTKVMAKKVAVKKAPAKKAATKKMTK